jgi:hypothetical protein
MSDVGCESYLSSYQKLTTLLSTDDDLGSEEDSSLGSDDGDDADSQLGRLPTDPRRASYAASEATGRTPEGVLGAGFSATTENVATINPYSPIYLTNSYQDGDLAWHCVVLVVLSSGAFTKDHQGVTFMLQNNATVLEVKEKWPEWFVKMQYLGALKESVNDIAFIDRAIKERMVAMRLTCDDPIISVLKLQLPFQVKSTITSSDFHFIGSESGTRVLYMNLKKAGNTVYNNGAVKKDLQIFDSSTA